MHDCSYQVNCGWIPPLDVAMKVPVPVTKFGLSTFLHKDAQTGCPNTPSKAQVRLWE